MNIAVAALSFSRKNESEWNALSIVFLTTTQPPGSTYSFSTISPNKFKGRFVLSVMWEQIPDPLLIHSQIQLTLKMVIRAMQQFRYEIHRRRFYHIQSYLRIFYILI